MKVGKSIYRFSCFVFVLVATLTHAQTIDLAPNGIKQCLVDNYPTLLDGNGKFDTTAAKGITTTLNCPNKGIITTTDLKYFTAVRDLKLNNNDIVDLSPIAKLSQLVTIDVSSNELEIVPDLTGFLSLSEFNANYNQLDNLPVFPKNIKIIRVGNNSLAGTIDVTGKTQLTTFEAFENDIKEFVGLETTYLTYADFHANRLNVVKDWRALITLEHLDIQNNKYTDLPQLPTSSLTYLALAQNALTFEDLLPYAALGTTTGLPSFYLQSKPETVATKTVNEGDSWTWNLSFDASVTTNIYHWYKDGVALPATTVGALTISSLKLTDAGVYYCEVENTTTGLAAGRITTNALTLKVNAVSVTNCFTLADVSVVVKAPSCQSVAEVDVSAIATGTVGTLTYTVNGQTSPKGVFTFQEEGLFDLIVSDANCKLVANKKVDVVFDLDNCEPPSFSPNGDGLDDTYYFNYTGEAFIYDKKGKLIQQLKLPIAWDGRKLDNTLADTGLYIVLINGTTKVNLTLLR